MERGGRLFANAGGTATPSRNEEIEPNVGQPKVDLALHALAQEIDTLDEMTAILQARLHMILRPEKDKKIAKEVIPANDCQMVLLLGEFTGKLRGLSACMEDTLERLEL